MQERRGIRSCPTNARWCATITLHLLAMASFGSNAETMSDVNEMRKTFLRQALRMCFQFTVQKRWQCPKHPPDQESRRCRSNKIHKITVYKFSQDFVSSKDNSLVESFNNTVLIYLYQRIHYKNESYDLRQSLAVLDWNETWVGV